MCLLFLLMFFIIRNCFHYFKSPIAANPWKGVRDATVLPPTCIHIHTFEGEIRGEEDCLYLNVYTPKVRIIMF